MALFVLDDVEDGSGVAFDVAAAVGEAFVIIRIVAAITNTSVSRGEKQGNTTDTQLSEILANAAGIRLRD